MTGRVTRTCGTHTTNDKGDGHYCERIGRGSDGNPKMSLSWKVSPQGIDFKVIGRRRCTDEERGVGNTGRVDDVTYIK